LLSVHYYTKNFFNVPSTIDVKFGIENINCCAWKVEDHIDGSFNNKVDRVEHMSEWLLIHLNAPSLSARVPASGIGLVTRRAQGIFLFIAL